MILFIVAGFIVAKIKGFKLKPALKAPYLYPLFILELVYIVMQVSFVLGNRTLLDFSRSLQIAFIAVLLPPIIKFSINLPAIISAAGVAIGTFLNNLVMSANNNLMPVFPTLSKLTGYYTEGVVEEVNDGKHIMGGFDTKLSYLADYIDTGWTIYSPGDVLIHGFITVIIYYYIKKINEAVKRAN